MSSSVSAGEVRAHAELERIVGSIKSLEPQARKVGTEELRRYVSSMATELPQERLVAFQRLLNHKLQELFRGSQGNRQIPRTEDTNRIAGTICISVLIDIDFMDPNLKITQFANYIYKALNTDIREQAEVAARTLGKIVVIETSLTHEIVDAEAKRCVEWLNDDNRPRHRRYVGSLVMRELVQAVPHLLLKRLSSFILSIWPALRDDDVEVRRVAATALRALILGVTHKDSTEGEREFRSKSMESIYMSCMEQLQSTQEALCHGSLLALKEMYVASDDAVLDKGFDNVCSTITKLKIAPQSQAVRTELVSLLPVLAAYRPEAFASHVAMVMKHLLEQSRLLEHGALTSIGLIIEAMKHDRSRQSLKKVESYVPGLLASISALLLPKVGTAAVNSNAAAPATSWLFSRNDVKKVDQNDKKKAPVLSSGHLIDAVACLKSLCIAFPTRSDVLSRAQEYELHDAIFSLPLEARLVTHLDKMCQALPLLFPVFQERLMNKASLMLVGTPFDSADPQAPGNVSCSGGVEDKMMALRALQEFDMSEHDMTLYTSRCCAPFLNHARPQVRKEAVSACWKLLVSSTSYHNQLLQNINGNRRAPLRSNSHGHKTQVLSVLRSLVAVLVSDIEAENRLCVMRLVAGTARFDTYFAASECLRSMVLSINDEYEAVSEMAIRVIGRLSTINPAHTLPSLRKVLLQLMTELKCTVDAQRQDLSARMLGTLIKAAPQLVDPYIPSLLEAILKRLGMSNPRVHGTLLATLGELSEIAGKEMQPLLPKVMPIVVQTLKDKPTAISVRQAVISLGQIMRSTGYVDVYDDYPSILEFMLESLQGAGREPLGTRMEIMRTFGIGGALEPHAVLRMRQGESEGANGAGVSTQIETHNETQAVVNALLGVLESPSQQVHHRSAVQALQMMVRALKTEKPVAFLPRILPAFLKLLQDNLSTADVTSKAALRIKDRNFAEYMFRAIANVVGVVKQHIRKYQHSIVQAMHEFWDPAEPQVLLMIINLCEELRKALNEEFLPHFKMFVPLMIQVVRDDVTPDRVLTVRVMLAFECFGELLAWYLHLVVPCIVGVFSNEDQPQQLRLKAIKALKALCHKLSIRDHAATLVHALAKLIAEPPPRQERSCSIMSTASDLNDTRASLASTQHSLQSLQATPTQPPAPLHQEAASALESLLINVKGDFDVFMPMVCRVLEGAEAYTYGNISFAPRDHLALLTSTLAKLKQFNNAPIPLLPERAVNPAGVSNQETHRPEVKGSTVNPTSLRRAWIVSGASAARDHLNWLSQFGQKLLQESPSPSLRAAFDISRQYPQLNYELFNVAFVSCYFDLTEKHRLEMLDAVKKALQAENLPAEVLQPLLNLAEYMERCDRSVGSSKAASIMSSFVPPQQLAVLAERCQLYAKALHYHEASVRQIETSMQKFGTGESWPEEMRSSCLEECRSLVHINNCLELPESSEGLLKYIQKHNLDEGGGLTADMYVNLGWWEKAYKCYEEEAAQSSTPQLVVGMFRCLDQMGDWPRLLELAGLHWGNQDVKKQVAPMVGHAAWLMSKWDLMAEATDVMPETAQGMRGSASHISTTGQFYRAVLAFRHGDLDLGQKHISKCRELMDRDLSTQLTESYSRAYELVVCLQQLSELEEVFEYSSASSERQAVRRSVWEKRLRKMNRDPKYLQGTLAIRSLVVHPTENLNSWLEFVQTCRWANKMNKAQQVLMQLLGRDLEEHTEPLQPSAVIEDETANPRVVVEYLSHLWVMNKSDKMRGNELLLQMSTYAQRLKIVETRGHSSASAKVYPDTAPALKTQVLLMMCQWQQSLLSSTYWQPQHREGILHNLYDAIQWSPNGYDAWHEWALLNYRIPLKDESLSRQEELTFVTRAVEGFARSISLCRPAELAVQDILRLLRAWFNFGTDEDVAKVVRVQLDTVSVHMWLQVIPQIIARIDSPEPAIQRNIRYLLLKIAESHPQAVTYPLVVCTSKPAKAGGTNDTDTGSQRRASAEYVLKELRKKKNDLVEQAELVARELIRVAILWSEMWSDALEEASRLYFVAHDPMAMIRSLAPLDQWLDNVQTDNERQFVKNFGNDLRDAKSATELWRRNRQQTNAMTQAWDLYYTVFRRLRKQLQQMSSLDLASVSPELRACADLEVAVPGQYQAGTDPVCIKSFFPTLKVISSKQRPRKLAMIGSDGQSYKFLLKGHEDLRQDERVMQLFGLVNTLLRHDSEVTRSARADLSISKYPVIPLSSNAGIIGWLERAETLHSLVRDYREKHKIQLDIETKIMKQYAGDFGSLSLMQKVEVFEHAMANTDGDDLNNILWLKASNSEVWLERRTNFTRSLATMSMVGYILGLGDRHPSNLMLDHSTGKAVHIDFGDCFEVAMQREEFPERIPFRLTRMLVRAMEVSGIEGGFRRTGELVMAMLRRNKDSLMAMLEAFVYDPLISWRLDSQSAPKMSSAAPAANHMPAHLANMSMPNPQQPPPVVASVVATGMPTNRTAVAVVKRIRQKLSGTDFHEVHRSIRLTKEDGIRAHVKKRKKPDPQPEPLPKEDTTSRKKEMVKSIVDEWKKVYIFLSLSFSLP